VPEPISPGDHGGAGWPLNPLEDQQTAGLLMWVPCGIVLMILGLALVAAWLGEAARRAALTDMKLPD
jgi:putative membrane protein